MNNASPAPPVPAPVLAALRQATRERHNRVDRLLDLRHLAEPARYRRVLQLFDAFLEPWEADIAAALPATLRPWLQQRSRRPFLQQDLRALALPPLGRAAPPLALQGPAQGWGALYVLEGSALGGQAIARVLAHAGLHPGSGAAYFHGWGERTSAMWQDFRVRMERAVHGPEATEAACAAARRAFDGIAGLLESGLHAPTVHA